MGLFELFWEMNQNSKITSANNDANRARVASQDAAQRIATLESSLDRLALINRALWEFMQERLQLTEQDLIEKVNEIDLRDGALDGKYDRRHDVTSPEGGVRTCDQCGRVMSVRHTRCLYCGAARTSGDAYDGVR
jgi:hypothetical protein